MSTSNNTSDLENEINSLKIENANRPEEPVPTPGPQGPQVNGTPTQQPNNLPQNGTSHFVPPNSTPGQFPFLNQANMPFFSPPQQNQQFPPQQGQQSQFPPSQNQQVPPPQGQQGQFLPPQNQQVPQQGQFLPPQGQQGVQFFPSQQQQQGQQNQSDNSFSKPVSEQKNINLDELTSVLRNSIQGSIDNIVDLIVASVLRHLSETSGIIQQGPQSQGPRISYQQPPMMQQPVRQQPKGNTCQHVKTVGINAGQVCGKKLATGSQYCTNHSDKGSSKKAASVINPGMTIQNQMGSMPTFPSHGQFFQPQMPPGNFNPGQFPPQQGQMPPGNFNGQFPPKNQFSPQSGNQPFTPSPQGAPFAGAQFSQGLPFMSQPK